MSPTSQSRQTSYLTPRHDHREPTGNIATSYNSNNNAGKLSSTTNIASDAMQRPPPRLSSAYRRTLETHRNSQSGSINLDTFDVPCPPSAPSPRALRFPGPDGFTMTASEMEKDGNGGAHGRRKSGCGASAFPSTSSSSSSAVGNVPDLGEVDLSDGKNKERPQRFKAVIHFKRRETDPSTRLRQGGGSSRPPRSGEEEKYGDPL